MEEEVLQEFTGLTNVADSIEICVNNLNKVIDLDNQYFLAYRLLGEIYLYKKDFENAVTNIKQGIDIIKRDAYSFLPLGKVL